VKILISHKLLGLIGTLCLATALPSVAQASPVSYRVLPVGSDGFIVDTVAAGNNIGTPSLWTYYLIEGMIGDRITLGGRRINPQLDLAFGVWDGLETDTGNFSSIFQDSQNFRLLAAADDEVPFEDGPFGDPLATFTLPRTGAYAVAFTSYLSGPTNRPLSFSAYAVPGPLPVMGVFTALGFSRRLRTRIKMSATTLKA
jgi:hypothetical protein